MTYTFDIERDDMTPMISRLRNRLANKRQMNAEAAGAMAAPIYANFDKIGSTEHNPFGVPASFWAMMKAGTRPGADDEFGWVAMPRPVALRYFGGTVYPGEGKQRLAIPAREEAYGKSPRDFSDLRLAFFGGQTLALVQTPLPVGKKTRGKRTKDDKGRVSIDARAEGDGVFFWLVTSATIKPNSSVLPPPDELKRAGVEGLRNYLNFRQRRGA